MIRRIIAFACVMYTCVDLSIVRGVAVSVPSVNLQVTFGALFGVVLALWITIGIKK